MNEKDNKTGKRQNLGSIDGFSRPTKIKSKPVPKVNSPSPKLQKNSVTKPTLGKTPATQTNTLSKEPDAPKEIDSSMVWSPRLNDTSSSDLNRKTGRDNHRASKNIKVSKIRKWPWKYRILAIASLLILIGIGLGGWDVWQLYHKVNYLAVGNLTQSVGGAENILVAGSTNRCNLSVQNAQWGFCSQGVTGVNSDIIFIVHVVPATHTVSLLSIPRDTFIPDARSGNEPFKIDAALYQGPTQLVNAIQEDFGIPIQHYAEVGFDGFVNIVNAVGGIKMDFPEPVYDSESYLNVKTTGCQLLNGVEALQVVRARHLQYDPPGLDTSDVYRWPQENQSDIARIARTHEFLRVLASTVESKGLGNPITDQKLIDAIAPQVQVDTGLSTTNMLQLAEDFHSVSINNVPQYTLPVSTTDFGSYEYGGMNYGDVTFPAEPNDQQVINQFLGVSNTKDTMTGKTLPNPISVNVSVVNASGVTGEGTKTASALQSLGFNINDIPTNISTKSSEAVETVVNYAGPSTEADAELVARQINGPVILSENSNNVKSGSDVTVITGTGMTVGEPLSSSTPTAATNNSAKTTTSTTTTAAPVAGLEAASPSTEPLSAWDPRACTN